MDVPKKHLRTTEDKILVKDFSKLIVLPFFISLSTYLSSKFT